jgi:hypothetical protein
MRRSRLSRSVKIGGKSGSYAGYHPKFKTRLRNELRKISRATGHPIHVLEERFMSDFRKMPLDRQYAVSQGVGMGGLYASMLVAGSVFGAPLLGATAGIPIVAMVAGKDIYERRKMKKGREEAEKLFA